MIAKKADAPAPTITAEAWVTRVEAVPGTVVLQDSLGRRMALCLGGVAGAKVIEGILDASGVTLHLPKFRVEDLVLTDGRNLADALGAKVIEARTQQHGRMVRAEAQVEVLQKALAGRPVGLAIPEPRQAQQSPVLVVVQNQVPVVPPPDVHVHVPPPAPLHIERDRSGHITDIVPKEEQPSAASIDLARLR